MPYVVNARIIGNEQALELIDSLATVGIPRESIHVIEATTRPEHRDDLVTGRSLAWGTIGGLTGAALGWVALTWWSMPWIGALWGGVIGAICGARTGGETIARHFPAASRLPSAFIEVETTDHQQTEQARRICADHRAWAITIAAGR